MFLPDHPIQFSPIFRSYLWGGTRLVQQLGKKPAQNGIWAESWEIVDHRDAESVVSSGPFLGWTLHKLLESYSEEILGYKDNSSRFPLLLKYLDCERVLSVQVHPDDSYGARMPKPDRGKTEAWYVIDAAPDAKLYAGLKRGIGPTELQAAIERGNSAECLHTLSPRAGDCVFIPAGTVHALGAGLLVAEIQQASDCTFRLYDWDRVDQHGNPRELHIEQAMEVIDFNNGPVEFSKPVQRVDSWTQLVECDKFTLLETRSTEPIRLPAKRASILTVPSGSGSLRWRSGEHGKQGGELQLSIAQTVLVPARCDAAELTLDPSSIALLSLLPLPS